jgi:phosphoribosylformylglycinamidine synthase
VTSYSVLVEVRPREGIADPQGATVERALAALGYTAVHDVRVGKAIRFTLRAVDEAAAYTTVAELCRRFLINPVIEDAEVSVTELSLRSATQPALRSATQPALRSGTQPALRSGPQPALRSGPQPASGLEDLPA